MIEFACPSCARKYAVPDSAAGRTAKCPCGQMLTVPASSPAQVAPPDQAGSSKLPMRTRRLMADAADMAALARSPAIRIITTVGEPAEIYRVEYKVNSLEPGEQGPVSRDRHTVEIQLTADYPRLAPKCKMLTPIFHPNIGPATICVGDHWTAGERLVDLVIRIGEMIAYQAYNIKSPLDAEAAMWADLNADHLPTDPRNLRPPELDA
jgi:ubiquitin-protein ligase